MRRALTAAAAATLLSAAPAAARQMDHAMHGMAMPAAKPRAVAKSIAPPSSAAHAGHGAPPEPEPAAQPDAPASAAAEPPGHVAAPIAAEPGMPGMAMPAGPPHAAAAPPAQPIPEGGAPPPPRDHAADRVYAPAAMALARAGLRREHGDVRYGKVMADLLEYQGRDGGAYRWAGQAWYGGDINRLVLRTEGEGSRREGLEGAELQALYSRAVGIYTDVQLGVRQDFEPRGRTYLTAGAQTLFPYWFEAEGALFLSTRGELLGRAEGSYDMRLTQRLILQPRVELNLAAQNSGETRTGAGLSDAELGLRLRYEIRREFAPYIGVSYERRFGRSADYARAAGQAASGASFVVGVRTFF